jgi:hypothetical protein
VTVMLAARAEPVRHSDQSTPVSGDDAQVGLDTKMAEAVGDADRSGPTPVRLADGTSPFGGRNQSVWRTEPVRLADPKDPKKQPKKEASAVRALNAGALDAALALPIADRAKLVLGSAREAQRLRPQQWLEAQKIAETYGRPVPARVRCRKWRVIRDCAPSGAACSGVSSGRSGMGRCKRAGAGLVAWRGPSAWPR